MSAIKTVFLEFLKPANIFSTWHHLDWKISWFLENCPVLLKCWTLTLKFDLGNKDSFFILTNIKIPSCFCKYNTFLCQMFKSTSIISGMCINIQNNSGRINTSAKNGSDQIYSKVYYTIHIYHIHKTLTEF